DFHHEKSLTRVNWVFVVFQGSELDRFYRVFEGWPSFGFQFLAFLWVPRKQHRYNVPSLYIFVKSLDLLDDSGRAETHSQSLRRVFGCRALQKGGATRRGVFPKFASIRRSSLFQAKC